MKVNSNYVWKMCSLLEASVSHLNVVLQCEWSLKLNVMFSHQIDKDWELQKKIRPLQSVTQQVSNLFLWWLLLLQMFCVTSYIEIILQSLVIEDMKVFYHKYKIERYKNVVVTKELPSAS
jgi:hypothetical protein